MREEIAPTLTTEQRAEMCLAMPDHGLVTLMRPMKPELDLLSGRGRGDLRQMDRLIPSA